MIPMEILNRHKRCACHIKDVGENYFMCVVHKQGAYLNHYQHGSWEKDELYS